MRTKANDPRARETVRGTHTPGPWVISTELVEYGQSSEVEVFVGTPDLRGKGRDYSMGNAPHHVCRVFHNPGEEHEANARLIAAAPDLLAALQGCIHHDDALKAEWKLPTSLRRQIEAAISKAVRS